MNLSLMEGNEAVVRGALYAGCNFFAGYPITPATSVLSKMLELLPPKGGVCLQGEDEIGSMGYCLGASMAGCKAMTATSGPGVSLYSEQLSFAVGSEIPLVIVNVQRLGPSTGSATKGADGDIQFMRWGNSGGLPLIVLAPVDVADCYTLTIQAFNLAERFRTPVFVASNKEIGLTRESIDLSNIDTPGVEERKGYIGHESDYLPFRADAPDQAPPFVAVGESILVRQTSSTHGENGYITTDPEEIAAQRQRIKDKLELNIGSYSYFDYLAVEGSDTLILTYGVTARAARQVVVEESGEKASLLVLKTLWPVPEELILEKAADFAKIVVLEMNLGQYVYEIRRIMKDKQVVFFGQMNGALITPDQIREVLANV